MNQIDDLPVHLWGAKKTLSLSHVYPISDSGSCQKCCPYSLGVHFEWVNFRGDSWVGTRKPSVITGYPYYVGVRIATLECTHTRDRGQLCS